MNHARSGVVRGTLGGHEYVVVTPAAGPTAPTTAATRPTRASTSAGRGRCTGVLDLIGRRAALSEAVLPRSSLPAVDRPLASVSLVGVYRAANAEYVSAVSAPVLERGWTVAWWALDQAVPDLAAVTVGSGPGARLALVNEVVRRSQSSSGWLVVSDDDVVFDRGDAVTLVALCERAELDLAQPARTETELDHRITAARRLSRVRRTSFVEIGPLFVVGPRWRDRIVPFPEERGMGWGLELDWHQLHRQGCRLGIVDAVRVRHEGERGEGYDYRADAHRVHAELEERGFGGWSDVQQTLATWRPWQHAPAWRQPSGAA